MTSRCRRCSRSSPATPTSASSSAIRVVAQLRVGGALSVRDVRVALGRLEKLAPVRVVETDDTFTLDYRNE